MNKNTSFSKNIINTYSMKKISFNRLVGPVSKKWQLPILTKKGISSFISFALAIFLLSFSNGNAQIIYVSPDGIGGGTSWSDARGDLTTVLNSATAGTQIWVAEGTYYPTICSSCDFTKRDISFTINDGVELYGGFAGTESSLEERNWQQHPSILSGDIDDDSSLENNSFSVIYTKNVGPTTVVDGFVIQDGNANSINADPGTKYTSGGGWYNDGVATGLASQPTVRNCVFVFNFAGSYGAGMYNEGSFDGEASPFYFNCRFSTNESILGGAGVYNNGIFNGKASPRFTDCEFSNNLVSNGDGAAVYNRGGNEGEAKPIFLGCNFTGNFASMKGGAVFNTGIIDGQCHPEFSGCNFSGNESEHGGGVYNDGSFNGHCNPVFSGCNFRDNEVSQSGAGMYNSGIFGGVASPELSDCLFENNIAGFDGGGIFSSGAEEGNSHAIYNSCFFIANTSGNNGGGIINFGKSGFCSPQFTDCAFRNNMGVSGGGVYNDGSFGGESKAIFNNCEFEGNQCEIDGAGMYNIGFENGLSNPELTNCRFLNNHSLFAGAGIFNNGINGESSPDITNCQFIENIADNYGGAIYNHGKSGNSSPVVINTLFSKNHANSAGGIYNLGAEGGNSNPIITNCTFYDNRANVGGSIYANASDETGTSSPLVTNCIFLKNEANFGSIFRIIMGTPTIQHSLVDLADCDALYSGMEGSITCGDGVLFAANPMFQDTAAGNFHLLPGSPAIDEGNNPAIEEMDITMDLDNMPRIQNGTVDLGVYEFSESDETILSILTQPNDVEVCEGMDVVVEITASGEPPLMYQWQRNGENLIGATNATLLIPQAITEVTGTYICIVTNTDGEEVSSNPALIQVHPVLTPDIEIFSNTTNICGDADINFWVEVFGQGNNPSYEWRVNGEVAGGNSPVFSPDNLSDGAIITCMLTSSEVCAITSTATSNSITVTVGEGIIASVEISTTDAQLCEGDEIVFVANANNEGSMPDYQWLVNGAETGETDVVFRTTELITGDVVTCQLTSSENCVAQNPVYSNSITMTVHPSVEPVLTISSDSTFICQNSPVTFSTLIINGGGNPSFDWRINGESIGEHEAFLVINSLEDGDVIDCQLTSSAFCALNNPVLSNAISMGVDPDCINTGLFQAFEMLEFELFPNPNPGDFIVKIATELWGSEMTVMDVNGKIIEQQFLNKAQNEVSLGTLSSGIYWVRLVNGEKVGVQKVVVW